MKVLVGSYDKGLYEVGINEKKECFSDTKLINKKEKVSYLENSLKRDYIFIKNDKQFAFINGKEIDLGKETSCHIHYDKTNDLYFFSQYHSGDLKVLDGNNLKTVKYNDTAKIHFSMFIDDLELLGVCDLGNDCLYFYSIINKELKKHSIIKLNKNTGPRHFVYNSTHKMIYVITEHSSEIYSYKLKNNNWILIQNVELPKGAASAIRISKNNRFLYAAVRNANLIVSYEILDDGLLVPLQVIESFGDHPRDFNLSKDNKFLVAANMHSNNLSLYSINKTTGILILLEKDYYIPAGASVLFI